MERSQIITISIGVLMVTTGSLNTIAAKWADSISVDGRKFDHPFFQATCMFIGEFSCLLAYFIVHAIRKRKWQQRQLAEADGNIYDLETDDTEQPLIPKFNPIIFLPPAACDVLATSLMYIGLNLTTASSFQMLRGAVIVFTGLLSVAFLRMKLQGFKWLGMGLVMAGLVVVGLCDIYDSKRGSDIYGVITGDLLIIMAQIIVAIQMVTEQKFLERYDVPPLLAVGLEGLFGILLLTVLMVPMYFIHVPITFSTDPAHRLENVFDAFREIGKNPTIALALFFTIISIAFFNFAGVSVTKRLSATSRMVLDSVRTLLIWILSIPLFHEKFIPLQLLGFGLLILGMFVYNDLLFGPRVRRDVIPRISFAPLALFCTSFWGVEHEEVYSRDQLIEDNLIDNME